MPWYRDSDIEAQMLAAAYVYRQHQAEHQALLASDPARAERMTEGLAYLRDQLWQAVLALPLPDKNDSRIG